MVFTRRDPWFGLWNDLGRFQQEFNRLFEQSGGNERQRSAGGPLINVWEDDHNIFVETDLPGIPLEKLEIYVQEGNQLTIKGERPAPEVQDAVWHRQERPSGVFTRTLTLPVVVDADKVEATLEQGVLRVTLPKSDAVRPRKITVKGL